VLPEHRRRGLGRALMLEAMRALKNDYGCDEIYLEVRVSNYPAINLYKSLGLKIVDTIKHYYLDGEDAYVMAAEL
jgi:ribosomal-protein-alanine N-acetyltransferase